jgi:hypothetical protein
MRDYSEGKIYRITCNITGMCYIGSTCKSLSERLRTHESAYTSFLKGDMNYVSVYKILENKDYNISLLQAYPCENNQELLVREGWYQKKYCERSVNLIQNGQTDSDIKEYMKQYYQDNKEKILETRNQYYDENKEAKKQYYQRNKEALKKYQNDRYHENKNKK